MERITEIIDEHINKNKVICEKCGKELVCDFSIVYTSYPPQYEYCCECGFKKLVVN